MPIYFKTKTEAVRYVDEMLGRLKPNSVLTTTILLASSGVFSAITVTEELSAGTGKKRARRSYKRRTIISPKNTPDG